MHNTVLGFDRKPSTTDEFPSEIERAIQLSHSVELKYVDYIARKTVHRNMRYLRKPSK